MDSTFIEREQPECWTRWLRESRGTNCPVEKLNYRDRRFRYTIVHALLASNNFILCKRCLSLFENGHAKELFPAKDKEGDTPMHSAIRSHVDPCIITTFLKAAESVDPTLKLKKTILTSVNNKGECPLKFACTLHDWSIVEVLLQECIRCDVLSELTGIRCNQKSSCKTLLHKAMKCGDINYLEIYFKVCRDQLHLSTEKILAGMLIPDQKNRTPWFYFLAIEAHKINKAVDLLEKYEISLNKLFCEVDEAGDPKVFMLHEATRQEKEEVITLLCDHGVETDKKDGNGLTAKQRSQKIMPSTDTPQGGSSVMKVNPEGDNHAKRRLDFEVLNLQNSSEAGLSSECAGDVSHSPGVQPLSPQCPALPITGWQSAEVPCNRVENDDDQDASTTYACTEDAQGPLFYIGDQLYLATADNHYHNNRFSSPLQFRKCKLYDGGDSERDLLLEFSSSSSPILGELHEGLQFINDSFPARIFLPGYSLTNRRLPDLRPVRRLDHFLLELNSSTTVPFLGEVHYDLTSPKYTDHEVCQLPDASYMLTSCIWSNTKFNQWCAQEGARGGTGPPR